METEILKNDGRFKKGGNLGSANSSWKGGRVEKVCIECSKLYLVYPYRKEESNYCSRKCGNKSKTRAEKISITHKKIGLRPLVNGQHPWLGKKRYPETIEKVRRSNLGKKASLETRIKMRLSAKRGKYNNMWKGGLTSMAEKVRKSLEYRLWREAVFKRDDWTCQECKVRGEKLNAHHIKPFAWFPELRFAIDNGITLCVGCHKKTDTYLKNYKRKDLIL